MAADAPYLGRSQSIPFTRPRRFGAFGRSVTTLSVLIFIATALMCYYYFIPVGYGSVGTLGTAALAAPPAILMVGVVSLLMVFWSLLRRWRVAFLAFSANVVLCAFLAFSPSYALWKWATDHNISLNLEEALLPQFNSEDLSRTTTIVSDTLSNGARLRLDAWPADMTKKKSPRPTIIKVHGGTWLDGSRRDFTMWNSWLNKLGYHVFDVDYRTPPPDRSLDEIRDVKCAMAWVKAHAAEYNIDTTRLILMGYSTGANMAMLAAYSYGRSELQPTCGLPVAVKCVINLYGPTDMKALYASTGSGNFLQPRMRQYIGGSPSELDERYDLLSPINHVSKDSPPTISIYGEKDRIIPFREGVAVDNALKKANVHHELYILPETDHSFDANWSYLSTQIAREKIRSFLHKYAE